MSKIRLKDITSFDKGKQINGDKLISDGKYYYLNGGTKPSGKWNEYNTNGNTIAVSEGGNSCGYVNFMNNPFWCGAHCYYLYDIKCNIKYLYYALKSQQDRIMKLRSGACMPNIKKSDLGNFVFEYNQNPDDQAKTVYNLDRLTLVINLCEVITKKLDTLVKSRFVEMFGDLHINSKGWEYAKFTDIADIDGTMTTDFEKYANYPHIGIDSIQKNTGDLIGYRTVSEDNVVSGKYLFSPKHIIYSKIRPNLNKVALPTFNGVCSADAYPILPIDGKCNRTFLAYVMRSDYFLNYILQFCMRTNLPKVNRKELSGFVTPLPSLNLQNQFADFVTQIDKSKYCLVGEQILGKAEMLIKILKQEYFG